MNSPLKKLLMKLDTKILKACIEKSGYFQEPYLDKEHIISSIVLANIPELNKMKFDNLENINKFYDYLDYISERRGLNQFNKLYKQLIKNNKIEIINFFDKYNNPPASFITKYNFDDDRGTIFNNGNNEYYGEIFVHPGNHGFLYQIAIGDGDYAVIFNRDENGKIIHNFGDVIGALLHPENLKIVNIDNELINIPPQSKFLIIPYEITQFINDFEYKYGSMSYNTAKRVGIRLIRIRPQDYFIIREFGNYLPNNYKITIDQVELQMIIYSNNRLCLVPLERKGEIFQVTNKNRYNIRYIKKYINAKDEGYTYSILKKLHTQGYATADLRLPNFFIE